MIRYSLACENRHVFESWFQNSEAFDRQAQQGLVTCPTCGSVKVEKTIMAPALHRARKHVAAAPEPVAPEAEGKTPVAMVSPEERAMRAKLRELRDHLTKNSDYVGPKFPEEARKMHYGEVEHRSIYGEASAEEAKALHDEGIEFHPLPVLPDERN
jgi:hypothetical protein